MAVGIVAVGTVAVVVAVGGEVGVEVVGAGAGVVGNDCGLKGILALI